MKYFYEIAKSQDEDALLKVKEGHGSQTYKLQYVRENTLPNPGKANCIMAFVLPQSGTRALKLLFTTQLTPRADLTWLGKLGPQSQPNLNFAKSSFFDEDGQPKGDYEAESILKISSKEWLPEQTESWGNFLAELDRRCTEIFGGPLHEFAQIVFGNFSATPQVIVIDVEKIQQSPWCEKLKELLEIDTLPQTIETILADEPLKKEPNVNLQGAPRMEFTGHMDSRSKDGKTRQKAFPLDTTQRLAAMNAVSLKPEISKCLLAVNGPPGTGKTSFLKAVLATQWVNAALTSAEHPPIIYATGATNKAVINIIEAFGNVASEDPKAIESRWLDGLPSYGWFYPSGQEKEKHPELMSLYYDKATNETFSITGAADGFKQFSNDTHLSTYTQRATRILDLPITGTVNLTTIISALHERLQKHHVAMQRGTEEFSKILLDLQTIVQQARHKAGPFQNLRIVQSKLNLSNQSLIQQVKELRQALHAGDLYYRESQTLQTGWRAVLPEAIRVMLFKKRLNDLHELRSSAKAAIENTKMEWRDVLPVLNDQLVQFKRLESKCEKDLHSLAQERQTIQANIEDLQKTRNLR